MKRAGFLFLLTAILSSLLPFRAQAEDGFNRHFLLTDEEMTDMYAMGREEIRSFLARGALFSFFDTDVDGNKKNAADLIYENAHRFGINPQFLLVLLQREQSLVQSSNPSRDQLDWAMGYAICDDCSKDDPALQKYRGFANQVYYAAKRIRESYLTDLAATGTTVAGVGPGISTRIDDQFVIPANQATAVLYTYTPHLHGNENFVKIWNRWFRREYPSGTLLRDAETNKIYLIKFGRKQPITSMTALLSRFNPESVITVDPDLLDSYEEGPVISFPNYSLLRNPAGTVYLLVDETLRGIASMDAFRSIGFNPDEIVDVTDEELVAYAQGPVITAETKFPQGILLQDPNTGGVFFVENGGRHPIMSREILENRFLNWPINPVKPEELAGYELAEPVPFADGTLIGVLNSPDVFVIADGMRRLIEDETTFFGYGYRFESVIWANERSVLLHPLGESLTLTVPEDIASTTEQTSTGVLSATPYTPSPTP